ncbi:MAG: bifunctional UDP-N-acetylglucosamine diphosphorylase/glucosamine-1-phosphate N-acetyltransferase GlmU [Acidobacteriota bacterium]
MEINILIMAAGLGTRMKSRRAKVLHMLAGQPLVNHVYQTALTLMPRRIIVIVGYQAEQVEDVLLHHYDRLAAKAQVKGILPPVKPEFVLQAEQHGTGHAAMMARNLLATDPTPIVLLSGDVPLVEPATLQALINLHQERAAAATVLTTQVANPTGYGRVVRSGVDDFSHIIEHRDATPEQLAINEINTGIYCFEAMALYNALDKITPANAQGEYYLTDVLGVLKQEERTVTIFPYQHYEEVLGINNRIELAAAEKKLRDKKLESLMCAGVTILDPASTYIDAEVEIGIDTTIYPQVNIEGNSVIGENCTIAPGVHLINCRLGDNVTVRDHCLIVDSVLENQTTVGPFAHLRMEAHLAAGATVGNFVEVKKSSLGERTKAMHLAYLGDATIGNNVNIGAGTITCNYDGKRKHATFIEDNVKIGSDTMLVAPVRVGQGAVTGAGTVVTKDIPAESLAVGVPAVVKKQLSSDK